MFILGLKAEWNEGQSHKIKIRSELYKKGCVSDVDEGLKVSHLLLMYVLMQSVCFKYFSRVLLLLVSLFIIIVVINAHNIETTTRICIHFMLMFKYLIVNYKFIFRLLKKLGFLL